MPAIEARFTIAEPCGLALPLSASAGAHTLVPSHTPIRAPVSQPSNASGSALTLRMLGFAGMSFPRTISNSQACCERQAAHKRDGTTMVLIPGRVLCMGSDQHDPDETLARRAKIGRFDRFWIGRTPRRMEFPCAWLSLLASAGQLAADMRRKR